jgi:hypothetical protein
MKATILALTFFLACFTALHSQNNPPVAVNDTVTAYVGDTIYLTKSFLLRNDYDPDGDTIQIYGTSGLQKVNDTLWTDIVSYNEISNPYLASCNSGLYGITDEHGAHSSPWAKIIVMIKGVTSYDSININNINALISPFGDHFWDFKTPHFEVPRGSGKEAVFSHSLWIAGYDNIDSLHLASERYRQVGADFSAGPVSTLYDSNYLLKWNRVWKLNKMDITYHINNWNHIGYIPIDAIAKWPAHGDGSLGQSQNIAPFYDSNSNGTYEPLLGDYPLIRGDQAVYFVYNDATFNHTESKGEQLGVEIHGMAYEYDRPDDSTLNNTLFMHYDILNKSANNYHNAYLSLFADFDLGYANDDFIGTDVANGMIYGYNGTPFDGSGQPLAYGEHPPSIGEKIIGGPLLDPDGIDNPAGECNYGLNGLNFGDGISDNERYGMTNSMFFINNGPQATSDPAIAADYYHMMSNTWKDGVHLTFGGYGHPLVGGVGPDCNFFYPGTSDTTCNWGTQGVQPNGGYNQNGFFWSEASNGNTPEDRRGIASIGPFAFSAGQSIPLDYCFTFARDYSGDNLSSLELLRERTKNMIPSLPGLIAIPKTYAGIDELKAEPLLKVYPNPAKDKVNIVSGLKVKTAYQLYDVRGELVSSGYLLPGTNRLDLSGFRSGVYVLKCGLSNNRIAVIR